MKRIILLSMLSVLTFSACEKDLYDEGLAKEKETIKDLKISENFDWSMTQTITVNLTATVETPASVYVNEACTDEYKVIDYTIIPGMNMPLSVEVPAAINKLYVKYDDVVESFPINGKEASLVLASTKATTRGWGNGNNEKPIRVGTPWSTLMFEDLFPQLGDYDFNDFVANYRYDIVYTVTSNNQGNLNSSHIVGYEFEFRVNAVGATKDITPYLKVSTKNSALLSTFNINKDLLVVTGSDGVSIELIANREGYQLYKFVGMTNKAPNQYINTEVDKPLNKPLVIKVEAHSVDNQGEKWSTAYSSNVLEFDFFIYNGSTEIHKRGFAPALGGAYPSGDIEDGAGSQYYSNGNNLIWAIDVPAVINHAVEQTNFLKAYPQFKAWATSSGTSNANWYNSPVSEHIINYMGAFPVQ